MLLGYDPNGRLWAEIASKSGHAVPFTYAGKYDISSIGAIAALIQSHESDIVHTQGPASLDLLASIACWIRKIPHVITRPVMIDDLRVSRLRKFMYRTIDRIALTRAAAVVAVSNDGYERLTLELGSADRICRIYNGIECAHFKVRETIQFSSDSPKDRKYVVGGIGQLTKNKGWEEFLRVIELLRRKSPMVRACIVGDGPERNALEHFATRLGLSDSVKFLGHIDDVSTVLKTFDVFLLMSRREGLSVAVLEAMACGVPCVCTDIGGVKEQVLENVTGYLVNLDDVLGASSRVESLLENPMSRTRMGAAARQLCETQFTIESMVENYQQLYSSIHKSKLAS